MLTVDIDVRGVTLGDAAHCQPSTVTLIAQLDQAFERMTIMSDDALEDEGSGARHQGRQAGSDRLRRRSRHRDLRLHRVRHRRRALLRHRVLPELQPGSRHLGARSRRLASASLARPLGGIIGGHLGDKTRPQAGPGRVADRHGPGHVRHRPAAHLRRSRCAGARSSWSPCASFRVWHSVPSGAARS